MEKTITLEPMFESMDIEKDQKIALQEAFDTAVLKKTTLLLDEHVNEKVQEKVQVIQEEYDEKVEGLTESLDGYLDTVVDDFIQENAPMYEAQIEAEKASTLLDLFDQMSVVAGVEMLKIQEAKDADVTLEDDIAAKDDKISELAEKLVEAKRESNKYLKLGLVAEMSKDLSILEGSKFEKLADMVDFDRSEAYMEKLETLKESIIDTRAPDFELDVELPSASFKQPEPVNAKQALDFSKFI